MSDKKAAAAFALHSCYADKICPWLSAGMSTAPASPLVGPLGTKAGSESEAIGCQGPNCMAFLITGEDGAGNPTRGACAIPLLPSAILQVRDMIGQGIQALLQGQAAKH